MAKFGKSLFPLSIFFLAFERDRLAPNDLDSKQVRDTIRVNYGVAWGNGKHNHEMH